MYVWGRIARMVLTAQSRGAYRIGEESRLSFRCLPTDIDLNRHLNNARYLMLADLGRIDLFLRMGFLKAARQRNWAPMLGGQQTVFVREIKLWKPFDLYSSVETWDDTQVIGRHRFVHPDGRVAAMVMTTAGAYDHRNKRFLKVEELMEAIGLDAVRREPTPEEKLFMESSRSLRTLAKRDSA
ncbi:thioesterase family protein [Limoniibacter endophyticus]|uniref:Acyl-CoA thioesterase FadM n=1 Tax=Limoniibacter endophyticus TaxID=1565040 RepID=A0A8J3DG41_9HYPH|nr:thioesterase family protein [Limoniibacter endophyticus]GHC66500.1 hypothetical protein GCM10010136_09640 [Limoniibacter endophyticus]